MSIHARLLDEIRNRLTLSEIIGQRVPVTRAGREYKACCPFHKEKSPSFTINDDKQFYHCFGCGAHGDALNFVMQYDNLPFPEAVELLAGQAGVQMPKFSPEDTKKAKEEKDLYSLMDIAAQWFEARLVDASNREILSYVQGRGFSQDTINAFRIGFAPSDGQALRKYLLDKGYKDAQMIEVGLAKAGKDGREPYIFFRERVMIPVMDRRGRVIAFGGRILPDHMRAPDQGGYTPAKYMNSTETPIFNKSMVLYGAPQARQAAGEGQTMFVVEGYFDVIACHQAGFRGAVAPMGTALTEEQIMLLWKMIPSDMKEPVLCFDGDTAGRRAAERAMERILPLLAAGRSVNIAFLPDGEDPDSLIKSGGKSAFAKVLETSIPMVEFLWRSHVSSRALETPEQRAALIKALNDSVARIADRDVQKHYDLIIKEKITNTFYARTSRQNQGGGGFRDNRGGGFGGGKFRKPEQSAGAGISLRAPSGQSRDVQQRILMAAILNHPAIFDAVEEAFAMLPIRNERLDALRQEMIGVLLDDPDLERETLCAALQARGYGRELDLVLSPATYIHGRFAAPMQDDMAIVVAKWNALVHSLEASDVQKEIKSGWKQAFEASSEEEEERVRLMLRGRESSES